mmetsp:Transcript_37270/g.80744  ORF Transcript_37270/g.80744 Transcript_37270/m.80744 type:complete len:127 (-) Transcript_37270:341-721(-)
MTSIAIRKPRWHSVCGGRARCPEHHTTVRHAVVVPSWLKKQKRPTADVKDDTVRRRDTDGSIVDCSASKTHLTSPPQAFARVHSVRWLDTSALTRSNRTSLSTSCSRLASSDFCLELRFGLPAMRE